MLGYESTIDIEQDMAGKYRVRVMIADQGIVMLKFNDEPTQEEIEAAAETFCLHHETNSVSFDVVNANMDTNIPLI